MAPTGPVVVGRQHLDDAAARQLWNWQLRRQGLAEDTRLDTVASIADTALGLHAARLPSPYATVAARSTAPAVPLSLLQPEQDAVLTVRCMRKTLHALPPALAAAAHAATMHFRERDTLRAILNAGQPLPLIERTVDLLIAVLTSRGRMHHRELEQALSEARQRAWCTARPRTAAGAGSWSIACRTIALIGGQTNQPISGNAALQAACRRRTWRPSALAGR